MIKQKAVMGTKPVVGIWSFKIYVALLHPTWTIDAFKFPKHSIASAFLIHRFKHY
jgi:hypothetical protein